MRRWSYRIAVVVCVLAAMSMLWGGQAYAMPVAQEGAAAAGIPYSGQLAAAGGGPVADGLYDLRFALYAEPSEGEALWTAEFVGVPVAAGRFTVTLVPGVPVDKTWLAMWVRGPGEGDFTALEPRMPFDAVNTTVSTAAVDALSCDHTHLLESWTGSSAAYALSLSNTGHGDGLRVYAAATVPTDAAVYAAVSGLGAGTGVYGQSSSGSGVFAKSTSGVGLRAESTSNDGVAGRTGVAAKSGVYGYNSSTGYGVFGRSATGYGMGAVGGGDASGFDAMGDLTLGGTRGELFGGFYLNLYSNDNINVDLDNDNNAANACFQVWNGLDHVVGTICEDGSKSAVLQTDDYGQRKVYAMESPEVWLEDFGTAALVNGVAAVTLDPIFVQMISQSEAYHVFVTPLGESGVLYVADKAPGGFTVKEAAGGQSNVAFDWRIAAKRAGLEGLRTEVVTADASELK